MAQRVLTAWRFAKVLICLLPLLTCFVLFNPAFLTPDKMIRIEQDRHQLSISRTSFRQFTFALENWVFWPNCYILSSTPDELNAMVREF
jgi:hypothetical protein